MTAPTGQRPRRPASTATREHGTHARYALGSGGGPPCRCLPCRVAHSAYNNHLYRLHGYGRPPLVDAEPVRAHLRHLSSQGMGWKRAAKRAGVAASTVNKLLYGVPGRAIPPSRRVRRRTAEVLLAVTVQLDDLAPGTRVPALGTQRRLQALVAVGWPQRTLARRLGIEASNFGRTLQRVDHVTVATALAARALYRELWNQRPPTDTSAARGSLTRARNHARAHGWPPPAAWDDEQLDDPAAVADLGDAPTRGVDLAEVDHLAAGGAHISEIARRLGVAESTIDRARLLARAAS